ncbi:EpsG family protein, partial [Burkholderia pseudomultivorans]|uniref:EpsG family protein n=1 Tax=Burkholderia pseudomultivorans TaxID=1207504 RepID=UPI00158349B3
APGVVTDELGWRVWILFVNQFGYAPGVGVRITVVLLNIVIFYTLSWTRRPVLALILYAVIPVALPTVGLFQIRQGFAIAIAMYAAIVLRRPIFGALVASTIHTTFAIPAVLLIAIRPFRKSVPVSLAVASGVGFLMVVMGSILFHLFGGRRIDTYSDYTDDFTIKLLILLACYAFASGCVIYTRRRDLYRLKDVMTELSVMHIALVVYLIGAYFLFPFGKARVWYYVPIMLPYLMPEIKIRKNVVLAIIFLLYALVAADVVNNYEKGVYDYFIDGVI